MLRSRIAIKLRELRCTLRRRHVDGCHVSLVPDVDLKHHIHYCLECGHIIFEKWSAISPEEKLIADILLPPIAPMGVDTTEQSRYMN